MREPDSAVIWHGAIDPSPFGCGGRGELLPGRPQRVRPLGAGPAAASDLPTCRIRLDVERQEATCHLLASTASNDADGEITIICACGQRFHLSRHQRAWLARNRRPEPATCPACRAVAASGPRRRRQQG